jgi:hypothetical protein
MPKINKEGLEMISRTIRKSNQAFFFGVAAVFLLILIVMSFLVLLSTINFSYEGNNHNSRAGGKLIGGDRDAGGCLAGAGYSWCEAKKKCLRVWEESCVAEDLSPEGRVRTYINDNISFLVPENNTGGAFHVSEINFISDQSVFIGYDDGRDFYNAEASFRFSSAGEVLIEKFSVKNKNGEEYALQSCVADADCVPLPSECHPHACINKKEAGKVTKPEVCTMMFDVQAAYSGDDCVCDQIKNECINKNLNKGLEQ